MMRRNEHGSEARDSHGGSAGSGTEAGEIPERIQKAAAKHDLVFDRGCSHCGFGLHAVFAGAASCRKRGAFQNGDIIAFYFNNKILLKRVIGVAGDIIDIDDSGTVYVNGEALEEPYLNEKALGECDIELPYQVPDERVFVMGDHRSTSVDSRSTAVGCVAEEAVVGKVILRVWPVKQFEVL